VGYPLFGAIFFAIVWSLSAALGGAIARGRPADDVVAAFARECLQREVFAWLLALAVGVAPVVRYAFIADGRSLFP
jgi:hypothetical protein